MRRHIVPEQAGTWEILLVPPVSHTNTHICVCIKVSTTTTTATSTATTRTETVPRTHARTPSLKHSLKR